jgi:hypothetical protein
VQLATVAPAKSPPGKALADNRREGGFLSGRTTERLRAIAERAPEPVRELYAEEAAKRMKAGKGDPVADLPGGLAREQAARVVGVSGRLVQNAKRVVAARCDAPCRRLAGLP